MRKARNIVQARLKLAQQLDDALGIVFGAESFGNRGGLVEGAVNEADGMCGKH